MSNILKYQNPSSPLLVARDTSDVDFNKFLRSLPDNQRLTPEEDYHTYHYWLLNGRPKNFRKAKKKGMYHYDKSDSSYHAQSVAFDENGIGWFMKPKHHPTVKYELDWFNHGLETLEGGAQRPVIGKDREEWEDFKSKYQLDTTGIDYRYVPIQKKGGRIHIKKKNRGKFTDYCGGKVTEECIAKGKKSKDPKIRKRATFAANARKWKHENGGIIKYQNPSSPLINRVNKSKANFVKRLLDPNRKSIQNWVNPLSVSTHKLGWATEDTKQGAFVYPEVQEINGELVDFTHPSHRRSEGMNSAIERRDTVRMTPEQAKWFTENYKQYYPGFKDGGILKA